MDPIFNPGADGPVRPIAVQSDGKILMFGAFTTVAGQPRTNIARLNPDGTLDTTFYPGVDSWVNGVGLQADGKIIIGGQFTVVNRQRRVGLARLNPDGSLDSEFNPGLDGSVNADGSVNRWVSSLALQADGKILVAGNFTTLRGQPRSNIGRLNNTAPATQKLSYDGSTITWLRGGTSPEVWRTTFEASIDAMTWTILGAGHRVPGGWLLTNIGIPKGATIRARGFVAGSTMVGGIVETTLRSAPSLPTILTGDGAFGVRSNSFGFKVSGSSGQVLVVEGSTNLLQWLPLQTNTLGDAPFYFSDLDWQGKPRQFYRVRVE